MTKRMNYYFLLKSFEGNDLKMIKNKFHNEKLLSTKTDQGYEITIKYFNLLSFKLLTLKMNSMK